MLKRLGSLKAVAGGESWAIADASDRHAAAISMVVRVQTFLMTTPSSQVSRFGLYHSLESYTYWRGVSSIVAAVPHDMNVSLPIPGNGIRRVLLTPAQIPCKTHNGARGGESAKGQRGESGDGKQKAHLQIQLSFVFIDILGLFRRFSILRRPPTQHKLFVVYSANPFMRKDTCHAKTRSDDCSSTGRGKPLLG